MDIVLAALSRIVVRWTVDAPPQTGHASFSSSHAYGYTALEHVAAFHISDDSL
jgi:hypothetical protein